jgi:hypothetical protein
MLEKSLTEAVVTKRISPDGTALTVFTLAAGTTDVTSQIVDTAGYEGVRFLIGWGAIVGGAVTSIKARQGQLSNMSDAADLTGTAQTIADTDDNKVTIVDIWRPLERYVDLSIDRGTANATIDFILVELYGTRKQPVTQDSTVQGSEIFASPEEGTA